jgi:hypothetical protein
MNTEYVTDRMRFVEDALAEAASFAGGNPQLAAALGSLVVVIASGVYEDCVEYLFGARAAASADAKLQAFVKNSLDRLFRNPDFDNIANVLGSFDKDDAKSFRGEVSLAAKESLNSIVRNRHQVAHRGQYANVTLGDVGKYLGEAKEVLEKLEIHLGL